MSKLTLRLDVPASEAGMAALIALTAATGTNKAEYARCSPALPRPGGFGA